MASINDIRIQGESRLGQTMRGLSKKHRAAIKNAIEQYGGFENIPNTFWEELEKEIREEALAMMVLVYIAAHDSTRNRLRFDMSKEEVLAKANQVAGARADALAVAFVGNTRERLQSHLDKIRQQVADVGELTNEMKQKTDEVLSKERAESVAVTETTQSISQGQIGGADDYKTINPNATITKTWRTERDAKVCSVCAPLDSKTEDVWAMQFPSGPPAHPNCRCELVMGAKRGQLPELTRGGGTEPVTPGLRYGEITT